MANSPTHHLTTTKPRFSASRYIQGGCRVCFSNTFQSRLPSPFFLAPHPPSTALLLVLPLLGLPRPPSHTTLVPAAPVSGLCSRLGVEGVGKFLHSPPRSYGHMLKKQPHSLAFCNLQKSQHRAGDHILLHPARGTFDGERKSN